MENAITALAQCLCRHVQHTEDWPHVLQDSSKCNRAQIVNLKAKWIFFRSSPVFILRVCSYLLFGTPTVTSSWQCMACPYLSVLSDWSLSQEASVWLWLSQTQYKTELCLPWLSFGPDSCGSWIHSVLTSSTETQSTTVRVCSCHMQTQEGCTKPDIEHLPFGLFHFRLLGYI